MPKGERETHPYLSLGNISGATRLILGSFPVYECTDNDSPLKEQMRFDKGSVRFFYGSCRNSFWAKYCRYIDNSIKRPWNDQTIIESLRERQIAISDTIAECERYIYSKDSTTGEEICDGYSALDSALKNRIWNIEIIQQLITNGVTKVLCTSKDVLKDLEKQVICTKKKPIGRIESDASSTFQTQIVQELGGDNSQIRGAMGKVFTIQSKIVYALAIPSPGSPQRQAHTFGCPDKNKLSYAERYFEKAFDWLMQ